MTYVTVSTWAYDPALDEVDLIRSAEENLAQLKAMGAVAGHLVRTGPGQGMIIMIYPDVGTWNRVRDMVERIRSQTNPQTGGTLTAAYDGTALVSV
ncbi:MAG: hypothetical protein AAF408_12645 [Pseudomonadota bacterium]